MRVLMVTHTYPLHSGDGTAPFVDAIARSIARRGHLVDVVLPYHPEFDFVSDEEVRFFPYRYSPLRRWSPWGFGSALRGDSTINGAVLPLLPTILGSMYARCRRRIAATEYDVVHAHWAIPNGVVAAAVSERAGLPLVVSLHGSDISLAERSAILARFARYALAHADVITAPSDHLRNRAETVGAPGERTRTVRWGVDVDTSRDRRSAHDSRLLPGEENGSSDILFVAVGRLVECKGFDFLIDAAARVNGIRVAIVGDGDLRGRLERRAQEVGAPVTFVGPLPHGKALATVASADAAVVPFVIDRSGRVDGFGLTALEALALGRPLIATNVGSLPEFVEDGVNGLLVSERDASALAQAMERIRDDTSLRDRLAAAAQATPLARRTWDDTASDLEGCYTDAVEVRRRH
jgi:phosphatidyl-myo-inositol dimannoside synthase